jgi:hypothetical protein
VKRRILALFALLLVGCGSPFPARESIPLLTDPQRRDECPVTWMAGSLVAHPVYGTAIVPGDGSGGPIPVAWPQGYTGVRVGSEVEVFDGAGQLFTATGRDVILAGEMVGAVLMNGGPERPRGGAWLMCEAWD